MNTQKGRQLAGGRDTGGADLEQSHSTTTLSQSHRLCTATSAPDTGSAVAGAEAGPSTSHLLYTVRDAARMLSCSRAHVYRELQRGAIDSVLVGGRCRRISRASLEAYVARLEARGAR